MIKAFSPGHPIGLADSKDVILAKRPLCARSGHCDHHSARMSESRLTWALGEVQNLLKLLAESSRGRTQLI